MELRVVTALILIAICVAAGIVTLAILSQRRKRFKLRQRGIKTEQHRKIARSRRT